MHWSNFDNGISARSELREVIDSNRKQDKGRLEKLYPCFASIQGIEDQIRDCSKPLQLLDHVCERARIPKGTLGTTILYFSLHPVTMRRHLKMKILIAKDQRC